MTNHEVVEVGSMIADKYRVDRVLGQGGMGIVVQATHVQRHRRAARRRRPRLYQGVS